MKFLIYIFCFGVALFFSGCSKFRNYNNYTMKVYENSVVLGDYNRAAIQLDRCTKSSNKDKESCQELYEKLMRYQIPIADAIAKDRSAEVKSQRILANRNSDNPWNLLTFILEIQSGEVQEIYQGEQNILLEKAFYKFGDCAKANNPACMSQYGQMIIVGSKGLSETSKKDAMKKALYWLNLSARYGDELARIQLLDLEETIPTPDLAMEVLQRNANNLAKDAELQRLEAARTQEYYSSQMLSAVRRQNFISAMNQFFPRTVSCSSNRIGSYTYTNCN